MALLLSMLMRLMLQLQLLFMLLILVSSCQSLKLSNKLLHPFLTHIACVSTKSDIQHRYQSWRDTCLQGVMQHRRLDLALLEL